MRTVLPGVGGIALHIQNLKKADGRSLCGVRLNMNARRFADDEPDCRSCRRIYKMQQNMACARCGDVLDVLARLLDEVERGDRADMLRERMAEARETLGDRYGLVRS